MTYEHAIAVLQDGEWWKYLNEMPCDSPESKEFHDALDLAIASLRRRDADERKKPATLKWIG